MMIFVTSKRSCFLYFPRGPQAGPWGTGQEAVGQDRGNHSFPSPSSVDINNISKCVGWVGQEWTPDDTEYKQAGKQHHTAEVFLDGAGHYPGAQ